MSQDLKIGAKAYAPPELKHLTPEQTNLLLNDRATVRDPEAKGLLELLYPEPQTGTA